MNGDFCSNAIGRVGKSMKNILNCPLRTTIIAQICRLPFISLFEITFHSVKKCFDTSTSFPFIGKLLSKDLQWYWLLSQLCTACRLIKLVAACSIRLSHLYHCYYKCIGDSLFQKVLLYFYITWTCWNVLIQFISM